LPANFAQIALDAFLAARYSPAAPPPENACAPLRRGGAMPPVLELKGRAALKSLETAGGVLGTVGAVLAAADVPAASTFSHS
jgi:hypothetical protein